MCREHKNMYILLFSAEFTPLGEDHAAEYFFASDAR